MLSQKDSAYLPLQEGIPGLLAEASWLMALAVIPLSVDPLASHVFFAPKVALSQTAGLLSLSAMVLALRPCLGGPGGVAAFFRRFPRVIFPAFAFLLAAVVSSLFSVDPSRSGETSPVISQAPFSALCQVSLFVSLTLFLRRRDQLDRLVFTALASSFPVAIFALIQRFGLSPADFPGTGGASLAGGPIFLAGYLLMLMPLGIWKLQLDLSRSDGHLSGPVLRSSLLLLVQLGAFFACEKRGPVVGLVAAGCGGLVLLGAYYRLGKLLRAALLLAIAAVVILTALAAMQKIGVPLCEVPALGRLALVIPLGEGTGDIFRQSLWEKVPELLYSGKPLVFPGGQPDPHAALRPWLGYGPDTVEAVLPSQWVWILAWPSEIIEVSCHSQFWDTAVALGLFGLAIFFWFFLSVFSAGLRRLGLMTGKGGTVAFVSVLAGLLGGSLLTWLYDPGFFGLGTQMGFLAALLFSTLGHRSKTPQTRDTQDSLLLIALLAGLAGHWTDMAFVFPTGNTSLLFWIFSGAVAAISQCRDNTPDPNPVSAGAEHKENNNALWAGALTGCMLVAVAQAFIGLPLTGTEANWLVLVPLLIIPSWIFSCSLLTVGNRFAPCFREIFPSLWISAAMFCAYTFAASWFLGFVSSTGQLVLLSDFWGTLSPTLFVLCACTLAWVHSDLSAHMAFQGKRMTVVLTFLAICMVLWKFPVTYLRSEVASGLANSQAAPAASVLFAHSLELRPTNFRDRVRFSQILSGIGENARAGEADQRSDLLQAGMAISEFNLLSAHLGHLSLQRAAMESEPGARQQAALLARDALARAVRYLPQNETAWFDASLIERELLKNPRFAGELQKRADAITARRPPPQKSVPPAPWGIHYAAEAMLSKDSPLEKGYAERAIKYLDRALRENEEFLAKEKLPPEKEKEERNKMFWPLIYKGHMARLFRQYPAAIEAFAMAGSLGLENPPFDPLAFKRLCETEMAALPKN